MARSIGAGDRGGSTAMVGTSTGTAPYPRSCSESAPACSLVRGTSTCQPNNGRVSHHDTRSRCSTTGPMTATAGSVRPAETTSASTRSSVETIVRCVVIVPSLVTATGVSSARPCSTKAAAALPIAAVAYSTTTTGTAAAAAQSTASGSGDGSTTSTCPRRLSVNGMPAYAGTAVAAGTPGTTSTGTCARVQ